MQRLIPIKRALPHKFAPQDHHPADHQTRAPFARNLQFWVAFALLNMALFLPAYLLNTEFTTFWPATHAETLDTFLFRLFVWRENLDVFRFNMELVWMISALVLLARRSRPLIRNLFLCFYFLIFVYYAYESAMLYLYRTDPQFFSDYYLMRDGLGFLLENVQIAPGTLLSGIAIIVVVFAILTISFRSTMAFAAQDQLSRVSKVALGAFTTVSLTVVLAFHTSVASPMMVTSSAIFKLAANVTDSVNTYRTLAGFEAVELEEAEAYEQLTLTQQPDIYLIFIESYGSVLYKRPDYRAEYATLAGRMRKNLRESGWHMASALSAAPTWGGGSWLSYTSTLFGLHVENHPQYLTLVEKYSLGDERYPHLGAYLQSQGYQFVWLSALAEELSDRQWSRYDRFYGYDHLVRYKDLEYTGPHYGWGPSPPDQYSLNFAHQHVIAPEDGPSLLFFITQNSHFPWAPIPPVLEDWRDFQTMADEEDPEPVDLIEHSALRARYMESIVYSWEMLTDFIMNRGSDDAIYIIVGDHQPPRVSRRDDSLDTPVHIISRNADFTAALAEYGFHRDTLYVRDAQPTLRHEGLYTLLVRQLIEHYGTDTTTLPEYHPEGFPLQNFIQLEDTDDGETIDNSIDSSINTTPGVGTPTPPIAADPPAADPPATGTPFDGTPAAAPTPATETSTEADIAIDTESNTSDGATEHSAAVTPQP